MSITNYAELKTAVANWLNRSDLTTQIPDFISLAEAKLSSDVRARAMESRSTITTTAGNAYLTLPADMLEMSRLSLQTDPVCVLRYASPDQLATDYPYSQVGKPAAFSVIGGEVQLAPIPDATYSLELTYQQRIPALTDAAPTNWLLTAWPNAYLYATLCAAQPFIMNDERLQTFQALYREAVDGINGVDWYSGSTMRVRAK